MSSVCAGLGQALQQGWRQGFPLQASPFQELARQTGASLRELLSQCQQLQRQGALQGPRVHWAERLSAWRLRARLRLPQDQEAAALRRLAALPGCTWIEQAEPVPGTAQCTLHFELQARSAASLQAQRELLQQAWGPALRWLNLPAPPCPVCCCSAPDGPCTDPALAQRLEGGLPLCAHPFQAVAVELGRSEREVLTRLRHWQGAGDLQALGLAPPHRSQHQPVANAWLREALTPAHRATLARHAGVVDVQVLSPAGEADARLWISLGAPRELALPQLEQLLAAEGLLGLVQERWLGLRSAPRAQALLFAEAAAPTPVRNSGSA
ncbi:MAG: hypothetical protein U1E77_09895 [Inhella sp.]